MGYFERAGGVRLGDSLNTGHSANRGVFVQYRGLVALYRTLGISGLQESGLNGSGLDWFTGAIMRKSSKNGDHHQFSNGSRMYGPEFISFKILTKDMFAVIKLTSIIQWDSCSLL